MRSPKSPFMSPLSPHPQLPSELSSPVLLPHSPREFRIMSPKLQLSTTSRQSSAKLLPSTSNISLLSLSFVNPGDNDAGPSTSPIPSHQFQHQHSGSRKSSFSGSRSVTSPGSSPHVTSAFYNRISHYQRSIRTSSHYNPSIQLPSIPNSPALDPVSSDSSPVRLSLNAEKETIRPIQIPTLKSPNLSPMGTPGELLTPIVLEEPSHDV